MTIKRRFLALAIAGVLALFSTQAHAQSCSGQPAANAVCAGPTNGGAGLPGFRALVPTDIPSNVLNTQTANYSIATTDCGKTIQAGTGTSGFFTITVPSVAGFSTICVVTLTNGDTGRGKVISGFNGCSSANILWPQQSCTIGIVNGAWTALAVPGRWRPPANTTINFFTDFTNGSETNDGLAAGGGSAFKTVERCFLIAADQIDFNAASQTVVRCNMAAATADTQGLHSPVHALVGAQGGAAFQIIGAALSITNAVTNAGACKITVSSTTTYSANEVVSVYGVAGATGCNGTWKVTVTSSTELTLQGTTFGGAYTTGGAVTNGSTFNVTGTAIGCYFGSVIQFQNVGILASSTGQGLNPQWGCKVYLNAGNYFGGNPATHINPVYPGSQIHVMANIGIASGATNAFVQSQTHGAFFPEVAAGLDFVPGVNPSFSGLGFAYADTHGSALFQGLTINLNGNTVTGPRCAASLAGLIASNTGVPNTYFPGNSNCTATSGAVVN